MRSPIGLTRRITPLILIVSFLAVAVCGPTAAGTDDGCKTIVTAVPVNSGVACPGANKVAVPRDTPVTWCYQVANTGPVPIGNVTIVDAVFGALTGSLGAVGAVATSVPLAFSGEVVVGAHSAQASASDAAGRKLTCTPGEVTVLPASPAIAIVVTATVDRCPGSSEVTVVRDTDVVYCYAVTNTDTVTTLTNVAVVDDQFGPDAIGTIENLAPGATETVSATRMSVTHDVTSFATATATPVFGAQSFAPVSARDSITIDVP
jgi:hypothetical protein